MAPSLWLLLLLLASVSSGAANICHPGCHCDVESFGLFDSFSLTRVDCQGLGPGITMPVAIPLDTTHLDLSFNAMHGPLTNTMLAGPGYTTLVSLDLSNNHITKVSGGCFSCKMRPNVTVTYGTIPYFPDYLYNSSILLPYQACIQVIVSASSKNKKHHYYISNCTSIQPVFCFIITIITCFLNWLCKIHFPKHFGTYTVFSGLEVATFPHALDPVDAAYLWVFSRPPAL